MLISATGHGLGLGFKARLKMCMLELHTVAYPAACNTRDRNTLKKYNQKA